MKNKPRTELLLSARAERHLHLVDCVLSQEECPLRPKVRKWIGMSPTLVFVKRAKTKTWGSIARGGAPSAHLCCTPVIKHRHWSDVMQIRCKKRRMSEGSPSAHDPQPSGALLPKNRKCFYKSNKNVWELSFREFSFYFPPLTNTCWAEMFFTLLTLLNEPASKDQALKARISKKIK